MLAEGGGVLPSPEWLRGRYYPIYSPLYELAKGFANLEYLYVNPPLSRGQRIDL